MDWFFHLLVFIISCLFVYASFFWKDLIFGSRLIFVLTGCAGLLYSIPLLLD